MKNVYMGFLFALLLTGRELSAFEQETTVLNIKEQEKVQLIAEKIFGRVSLFGGREAIAADLIKTVKEEAFANNVSERDLLVELMRPIEKRKAHYAFEVDQPKDGYMFGVKALGVGVLLLAASYLNSRHASSLEQAEKVEQYFTGFISVKTMSSEDFKFYSFLYGVGAVCGGIVGLGSFFETFYAQAFYQKCCDLKDDLERYLADHSVC